MNASDFLSVIGKAAGGLAQGYAQEKGVRVTVKTNIGPEVTVWDAKQPPGSGVLNALGIKGAVIVRDETGKVIFQHGTPPATNPALSLGLLAAAAFAGFLIVRGFVKR